MTLTIIMAVLVVVLLVQIYRLTHKLGDEVEFYQNEIAEMDAMLDQSECMADTIAYALDTLTNAIPVSQIKVINKKLEFHELVRETVDDEKVTMLIEKQAEIEA